MDLVKFSYKLSPEMIAASIPIAVISYLLWKLSGASKKDHSGFPFMIPGAKPVVGNVLEILKYKGRNFCAFAVDFAPKGEAITCFRILFGAKRFAVNTLDAAREIFINQTMYSRDRPVFVMEQLHMKRTTGGLFVSSGPIWERNRRIVLNALRQFGLGNGIMEEKIGTEVEYMCDDLEKYKGKPCDPNIHIQRAVGNVIFAIIFGDRFEFSNEEFNQCLEHVIYATRNFGRMLVLLKKINKYLPVFSFVNDIERRAAFCKNFMSKNCSDCALKYQPGNPRCIVDTYFDEIAKEPQGTIFNLENMQDVIWELFLAGLDSTSSTILFSLVYMSKYPEVQEKVHQEIEKEIGKSAKPTIAKIRTLNYTMATIYELQRIATVTVAGIAVELKGDVKYGKTTIPKGSNVFTNIWAIHRDPENFPEPTKFDPLRFMDSEGKVFRRETLLPYGLGPRICVGKKLADYELMLAFTTIFQRFKVSSPDDIDPEIRLTEMVVFPETYQYVFELR